VTLKTDYQPRTNTVQDEKGDYLVTGSKPPPPFTRILSGGGSISLIFSLYKGALKSSQPNSEKTNL
jgi:hypothetical protein